MNTQTETLPPLIIDRSSELRRNKKTPGNGPHRTRVDLPPGEVCVQGDGTSCVIAEMMKTLFPGCEPHIEGEHPYIIAPDGRRKDVTLDSVIVDAIGRFDRGDVDAFKNIDITITWD